MQQSCANRPSLQRSIAHVVCLVLSFFIAVIALASLEAKALAFQTVPDSLIRYLAYVDSVKTLEMDVVTTNVVGGNPPMVVFAGHVVYFAESGNRFFRSDPLSDPRGDYLEVLQNGFRYRFKVEAKMGSVQRDTFFWPLTPLQMMGIHISHCLADLTPTDLNDLVDTKMFPGEARDFGKNGFVIVAPYRDKSPSEEDCGDVFVELAKDHQFAPQRIWIAHRRPDQPVSEGTPTRVPGKNFWFFEATAFESVNGVEIPTQIRSEGPGHSSMVIATNVKVNVAPSVTEVYTFPEDSVWVDELGMIHGNEALIDEWAMKNATATPDFQVEPVQSSSAAKSSEPNKPVLAEEWRTIPWFNRTYYTAGFFAIILIFGLVLWYFRNAPSTLCFLILSCPFLGIGSGCRSSSSVALEFDGEFGGPPVLRDIDYCTSKEAPSKEVLIKFFNRSRDVVKLPDRIRVSCGCTQAYWNQKEAHPNSAAELTVQVSKPGLNAPKHISVTSEYFDTSGKILGEVVAYIEILTDVDWKIVDAKLNLEHAVGMPGRGKVLVYCKSGRLPEFSTDSSFVRLTSIQENGQGSGSYSLMFECDQCSLFNTDEVLDHIVINNIGFSPPQLSLPVVSRLRVPYRLSRKAVVLPGSGDLTVKLDPGWSIYHVETTSPAVDVQMDAVDNTVSLSISSTQNEAISCAVVGKLGKEGTILEFRIPVLVSHRD